MTYNLLAIRWILSIVVCFLYDQPFTLEIESQKKRTVLRQKAMDKQSYRLSRNF
jgi:hypothetical protein